MVYLRDFLSFLGKRLVGAVAIMVGVVVIVFLISHVLNSDPAALWSGEKAHYSTIAATKAEYGLNLPLDVQLYHFLINSFTFNFGTDPVTGQNIAQELFFHGLNTVELVLVALLITILMGVVLGYISGMRFSTKIDTLIRTFYLASWATPYYLGAIGAILLFSVAIHILPSGAMYSPNLTPPHPITGIGLIDSLIELNFPDFVSGLQHIILPAGVLALLDFGIISRVTRSSVLDFRWSTQVKSARARGVPDSVANRRHVLRNALIDATTVSAVMFGWMLSGTIIVEEIFGWPGIGQFAYNAIVDFDYPALIPIVIFFTFGVVAANFLADVTYSLLDPRISLGTAQTQG